MKCLVLLLAVAVCQGAILRERSFEKRQDLPEVVKQVLQKYDLPSRQLKVSTIKKPVELLEKLDQTPWTQSTKPNVLDYINRFNKQSWQHLDRSTSDLFDYKNFRELIQFPGSEFLQEEIDKYIRNMPVDLELLPENVEFVKDSSGIVPMIIQKLEETVPQYTQMIQDPSTLAQLITKDVIKMILRTRMQCPTTTWDKYFIERVQNKLVRTMHQTKYQLLDNFQSWLPKVMPVEQEMMALLLEEFTQDVEQHLYKDIMQYVHGVCFKDIAVVSHKLYHELKQLFEQSWTRDPQMLMQQLTTIVVDVSTDHVTCPRQEDFSRKTEQACWDFQNLFIEREVARLHSRVQNLIHKIQYRPCIDDECTQYNWNFPQTYQRNFPETYQRLNFPQTYQRNFPQTYQLDYPQIYKRTNLQSYPQMHTEFYPRMNDVCKRMIKQYIETIVQNVPVCQNKLCTDPINCFQNYKVLEPKEMEYMQTLLKPVWNPLLTKINKDRQL